MRLLPLRSLSTLILAGAAISARAETAYSNILEENYYESGYVISPSQTLGYQFTSGATGSLSGFQIAMNNGATTTGRVGFTLDLYSDSSGRLGSLLGSYSGLSSGVIYTNATNQFANVPATGPTLASGTSYWLLARSTNGLIWNWVEEVGPIQPTAYSVIGGPFNYGTLHSGAFAVQVAPVPEPTSLAVLGVGAFALFRHRKRSRGRFA